MIFPRQHPGKIEHRDMAGRISALLDNLLHRRALRRWNAAADAAGETDLDRLRRMRGQARALRRNLDRVIHQADFRLALRRANPAALPANTP